MYADILQRQIAEIESAAYTILTTTRHNWPQAWNWDAGRKVARQSLNRIAAMRTAQERGDSEQACFEAFMLGRMFEHWKRVVPG